MLRSALHHDHDEFDSDGFRLRGLGFSRLDGFSDVVFGFALTLIVVSLEVPKSFDELHHLWAAFLPFGVTFLLLMLIWYEHFVFFRRYGVHDVGTVWLNGLLLFVILFYVYPLKFLFLNAFTQAAEAHGPLNWTEVVLLFAGGQATIYLLIAAMYGNAYRQRTHLLLTPLETFLTRNSIAEEAITGAVGLLVCALALLLPHGMQGQACLAFMLIGVVRTVMGFRARRKTRQLREAELHIHADEAAVLGPNAASITSE